MLELSKETVDALMPKEHSHYIVWDDAIKGFGVRVMPTGLKTYLFRYRSQAKDRKIKIGVHGRITAVKARRKARILSGQVEEGRDPAAEKVQKRTLPTMEDLIHDYLERHAFKKRPNSQKDDKSMIESVIRPRFAPFKVSEITRRDIENTNRVHREFYIPIQTIQPPSKDCFFYVPEGFPRTCSR